MPFRPHSTEQYNLLFHNFWCLRRPLEVAAKESMMNETHAFRACTGWNSGKDGAVGRTAFLNWIRDMKAPEGAPCCGGMMHPGKRKPASFTQERLVEMEHVRELETVHAQLVSELARMRKMLGLRSDLSVDAAPTGVAKEKVKPGRQKADEPPTR